ncbi:DUF554 domain-containing protein [Qiania dongpingensis]|uniref:DUF554 domain-containing protein n=1 Tax=Qiania dongpingensis TaxID=2763669 RepID=A0A7G9G156_9FIRM|nr:DUF554 domain-containing protein [Qiania dongpingensis]QNM04538.1 DUF554 domain-containing protein [Qiania dongpingensis]
MILTGVGVNTAAIVIGALAGILLRKRISSELGDFLGQGLGICVIYVGIKGSLAGENTMITILSMVIGGILGHSLDFDRHMEHLGIYAQKKLRQGDGSSRFAEGFVSYSLLVCVGAMAIVGSMQSGMNNNHEILFSKALIDGVMAVVMAAALGIGVGFAAIPVFLYEGVITLASSFVAVYLTENVINEMACAGSLLIIMLGLNMMKLTKIKVANYLLTPFIPIILCQLWPK